MNGNHYQWNSYLAVDWFQKVIIWRNQKVENIFVDLQGGGQDRAFYYLNKDFV